MITRNDEGYAPYKHQLTAYKRAWKQEFYALFMEMGTGKTRVSIDLASNYFNEMSIDSVLVVAPNSVHRQWAEEEVPKWCTVPFTTLTWSATKNRTQHYQKEKSKFLKSDKLKFFCVNIETFSSKNYLGMIQQFLKSNRCLMIVDESTAIKNPDANRTKAIINLNHLPCRKLILTGTPVTNSPFDLWGQFEFLRDGFFGCNFFVFKHRYGINIKDVNEITNKQYTRTMRMWEIKKLRGSLNKLQTDHIDLDDYGDSKKVAGVSLELAIEMLSLSSGVNEKDIHYIATHENINHPYKSLDRIKSRIDKYTYTVKKADCLDLPEKIYQPIYTEMTKEQKKVYSDTKKLMMSKYANRSLTVQNKLSLMLRLQQITGGFFPHDPDDNGIKHDPILIGKKTAKYARLEQDLEEVRGDEKIIIWCKFTAEIRYLKIQLSRLFDGERVESYYGGTSKKNKNEILDAFKRGEIKVLIANPASAGIGLNLQKSSLHYYYSNDFNLEKRLQSEDRSHRIGQLLHVVYKDIIIIGSIDDTISKALSSKKDLLEYFREKSLAELLSEGEPIF